ncbi:zinc ribbon domain-containing protein [Clostridium aciditolerans]|uniref:Zinc ribbon domain-containing protein n=1 Tax=Clostridium aciditolerans TaxID=339861 RepID=A0A934HVY7_9CLOT|nr:zinc ribbon domain-containing protein [Clostridium aciditolerans]MBI6871315.1 zinc ribbon domain-containing protein [Clostridium aciditolerans]
MERIYCQSCGMPLIDQKEIGTNEDGSKNTEYCIYCFENGTFKGDMTMEQMIEFCVPHMVNANPHMSEQEARSNLQRFLPTLKRWKNR